MRFTLQEFIEYDIDFINSADLPTVWKMQAEWYRKHCPALTIKELAREGNSRLPINRDRIWNEPTTGEITFSRAIAMHTHFELEADRIRHTKTGISRETSDKWWFSVYLLQEADWMPLIGDHILRSKIIHEITEVAVDPQHYWAHTNIPTIITCKTKRFQLGGNKIPSTINAVEI